VDIAPTTLGLCGINKPSWMEGTDYSHYRLAGNRPEPEPDSVLLQEVIPSGHPDSVNKAWRGLVTLDGWKYCCFENTSWLMFNLNDDPYEQVNVAHDNKFRAERQKLIARLKQWINDTGDRFRCLRIRSSEGNATGFANARCGPPAGAGLPRAEDHFGEGTTTNSFWRAGCCRRLSSRW
jgi:arylsulfatase A-like enzyme